MSDALPIPTSALPAIVSRYSGRMITVNIGGAEFEIHEAACNTSGLLASQIQASSGSRTTISCSVPAFESIIHDTDQSSLYVNKFISCLYTDSFTDNGLSDNESERALDYGKLYVIGWFMDTPALQRVALEKLTAMAMDAMYPMRVMDVARLIYGFSVQDENFKIWLARNLLYRIDNASLEHQLLIMDQISHGGELADDIVEMLEEQTGVTELNGKLLLVLKGESCY